MFINEKLTKGMLAGAASLALLGGASFAQTGTGTQQNQVPPGQSQVQPGIGTGVDSRPGAASPSQSAMLQEDDVKSLLEDHDYSEVEDLEQSGMAWTGKAKRDDENVELRIERVMLGAGDLDEERVKQLIETEGFSDVSSVEEDDDVWTADAQHDGDDVKIRFDSEEKVIVSETSAD